MTFIVSRHKLTRDIKDQLPNTVIAATIKQIAERVNHGFRDSSSDDPDDRDLPEGYHVVPTSLRLWRWELKPEAADTILPHLPEDMRQKMSTRLAERKGARAAARELLASLPEEEKVAILTKGIKTTIATLEKGKKAATVKEEDDVETPSKKPLSKAKAFTKNAAQAEDSETGAESSTKKKPGKPKVSKCREGLCGTKLNFDIRFAERADGRRAS